MTFIVEAASTAVLNQLQQKQQLGQWQLLDHQDDRIRISFFQNAY
jgi:hypothetical protein